MAVANPHDRYRISINSMDPIGSFARTVSAPLDCDTVRLKQRWRRFCSYISLLLEMRAVKEVKFED